MAKTIVLCCDGTGNADTGTPSNVKQLSDFLLDDRRTQITKYHRGAGTEPRGSRSWATYWPRHLAELGVGAGIEETLAELYGWLATEYRAGDRLFLFGFSRGAFTVRALSGMIHVCGLLTPDQGTTPGDVVRLYAGSEARIAAERRCLGLPPVFGPGETDHAAMDPAATEFKARHGRPCAIDFLGLWDTVKAYGWLRPRSFPALRHNPSVRAVRHAVALDERRALFQMTGWPTGHADIREVWFAGDHSDVGGGHTKGNSPLANASLRWMLGEAAAAGLRLDVAAKGRIAGVQHASAGASTTRARGLTQFLAFFLPGCLPRVELDNHTYPPRRPFRVLWPLCVRKPGDHAFGATVFVHKSVETRRERRYRFERLVKRSPSNPPAGRLALEWVPDLVIPDAGYSSENEMSRNASSAVDTL